MSLTQHLTKELYEDVKLKNKGQREFQQAVLHFLETIDPLLDQSEYFEEGLLKRFLTADRIIAFKVVWQDDNNKVQVNKGYRVQHNNALGPYKGGLRFHPSVNSSIIKFLAFDQTLKNALTDLLIGGAKGGSDFNPKGKSDNEIMRFTQAFMSELHHYLGPDWDIPAGDIGVGYREIAYMVGKLKQLRRCIDGTITGKPVGYGGSLIRKEATGYGLLYFMEALLNHFHQCDFTDKKVIVSGSGNVAIYAAEKAVSLGAKVIAMSDSSGYVTNPDGLNIEHIKKVKEENRQRIDKVCHYDKKATFVSEGSIWQCACDVALPCATQNEVTLDDIKALHKQNVLAIGEGANMPLTEEAMDYVKENNIILAPGIASNAGGVAVSALEMSQNASKLMWSSEEVDQRLQHIMANIFTEVLTTAQQFNHGSNLILGAQLAGYLKVAKAMVEQGIVY